MSREDEVIRAWFKAEERHFDVLDSWIEGWWEERKKVIRLQNRLEQNRCLSCGLAIGHGIFPADIEGYLEAQADVRGFFSQMDEVV